MSYFAIIQHGQNVETISDDIKRQKKYKCQLIYHNKTNENPATHNETDNCICSATSLQKLLQTSKL